MLEGKMDTYEKFKQNTKSYVNKIVEIRGFSFNVIDKIKILNEPIDLLFVDGDHSYIGVKTDWDLYFPLLKKGSIVIFHDYGWAEGVQKVIQEDVLPCCKKYSFLQNMWWGWIE
jgi:predicted O-methyltransferase YrrM